MGESRTESHGFINKTKAKRRERNIDKRQQFTKVFKLYIGTKIYPSSKFRTTQQLDSTELLAQFGDTSPASGGCA
jgi:hypothetical protein